MKLSIVTLLFLLLTGIASHGQDIIKTKSGSVLRGKVTNVTSSTITYKAEGADSALITLNTSELAGINYANGTKDVFETSVENPADQGTEALMQRGRMDARSNYKEYRSAKTLTTVVTALELPYGLIPAVACASSRPKEYNLNNMNFELMNNPAYRKSYADEAYRIKKREVWRGFGNGCLIAVVFYGAVLSLALMNH